MAITRAKNGRFTAAPRSAQKRAEPKRKVNPETECFLLYVPKTFLPRLEKAIELKCFQSRSEFCRHALFAYVDSILGPTNATAKTKSRL